MTPRVVAVVQEPLWPPTSGIGRRLRAYVDLLSDGAEVTVVSCLPVGTRDGLPVGMRHHRLGRTTGRSESIWEMVRAGVGRRPLTSAFYRRRGLRAALRSLLDAERPDLLVTHGMGGAALLEGIVPAGRIILDLADAEHQRVGEVGRARGLRGAPYRLDAGRIAAWCGRNLASYRLVATVSEADLASYRSLAPTANLALCPNGAVLSEWPRPDPGGRRVMFLGDLGYPPNIDALGWLVGDILPMLPDVELRVVGHGTVPSHPQVSAAGFVDDLDEEWAAATVLAVPVRFGGGTRLKVVEAFAAGVPVVSTAFGAAGLGAEAGIHYVEANSNTDLAAALSRLLADPALREGLATRGRELVADRLSWPRCLAPVMEVIGSTLR